MKKSTKTLPCPRPGCGKPCEAHTVAGRDYREPCEACQVEDENTLLKAFHNTRYRKAAETWRLLERRFPDYSPAKTNWSEIMPDLGMLAADYLEGHFEARGLWICGPTDIGKTRTVFSLMHQLCELGNSPSFANAVDISEAATLAALGDGKARAMLAEFRHSDIAVLDDLGKGAITNRCAEALYRMAEGMRSREATLIVTSNVSPAVISRQMGEFGDPFLSRIIDLCGDFHEFTRGGSK